MRSSTSDRVGMVALFVCALTGLFAIAWVAVTRASYVGGAGFALALGAVVIAILKHEQLPVDESFDGPRILDTLGIEVVSGTNVLVPAGARVPFEIRETFSTQAVDPARVGIHVVADATRTVARINYAVRSRTPGKRPQIHMTTTVAADGAIEISVGEGGTTGVTRYRGFTARLSSNTPLN